MSKGAQPRARYLASVRGCYSKSYSKSLLEPKQQTKLVLLVRRVACDFCLMTLGLLTVTVAGDCRHLLLFVAFLIVLTPGIDAVL